MTAEQAVGCAGLMKRPYLDSVSGVRFYKIFTGAEQKQARA
jgi:hypothetical protein